jgi:hypothetical protein
VGPGDDRLLPAGERSNFLGPTLHKNIQDIAVLITSPPKMVAFAVDREKDLIQAPLITWSRPPAPQLAAILLSNFPTQFSDRPMCDNDPTCEEEFFHISITEAESIVQPDAVPDNLGRETVVFTAVG